MKTFLIALFVTFISFSFIAQDCDMFFPFEEGRKWEITNYNKKDKVESISKYEVIDVYEEGGIKFMKVKVEESDAKGKEVISSETIYSCDGNKIRFSLDMMKMKQMENFEEMEGEVVITGNNLEIPNNLSVGDNLEDANLIMEVQLASLTMRGENKVTDREVVAKEQITTPAGSFDTFKITATSNLSMTMINITTQTETYVANDVGVVKTVSFDKNGKMTGYSLLTKFE